MGDAALHRPRLWQTARSRHALVLLGWAFLVLPMEAENRDRELWLDQRFSISISPQSFLLVRFSERANQNASHLFETFVEIDAGVHARSWLTILPGFIHLRFNTFGNNSRYENRPQLALQMHDRRGRLRPNVRFAVEGRFPEGEGASVRYTMRPGAEIDTFRIMGRSAIIWMTNEFAFDTRTDSYSRNRLQAGIAVPVSSGFSVLPYYLLESLRQTPAWDHDNVLGVSLWWRL